jgi:uncharacterized protein YdeI (BOF family)
MSQQRLLSFVSAATVAIVSAPALAQAPVRSGQLQAPVSSDQSPAKVRPGQSPAPANSDQSPAAPVRPDQSQAQISSDQSPCKKPIAITGWVRSIVGSNFTLNDGSGQVTVSAGSRLWQEVNLQRGEKVSVTGCFGRSSEFIAFSIRRDKGPVIEIRSSEGSSPQR